MSKKVLVITSSLRQGRNSDMLAQAFAEGARGGSRCGNDFFEGKIHHFLQGMSGVPENPEMYDSRRCD